MANYSLVANNVFRNRSFDDLLRPLAMYTDEYNNQEAAIGDMETKASVWEGMANEETDPVAYAQYKRYADDLKAQASALASSGLTPSIRRDIINLKRRYGAEIAPIEQAYANRKAQADEQRKALLSNPTLLLSRRADMTSLDDYINNQQLGYDSYSGALLTQQVGQAASAIAKELRDYGNGKRLDSFTKTWLQQHGFTATEVAQAINHPDDPRSSRVLNTIVNNVIADSGIPQWADRATLNQAYDYARQGLWQAVGQTQVSPYTDKAAELAAQERMQKRIIDYQNSQNLQKNTLVPLKGNPFNLDTTNKVSSPKRNIDKYSKYFDRNGNLTKKGLEEYNRKETEWVSAKGAGSYKVLGDSPFKKFMDGLNGGKTITTQTALGPWAMHRFRDLFNGYKAKVSNEGDIANADIFRNTAFDIQLKNQSGVKQSLTSGKNSGVVPVYSYGKDGYKDTYKTINLHDSEFKDATYAGEIGPQGNFIVVTTTENKQYRVPLRTVHPALDAAIRASFSSYDPVSKEISGALSYYYKPNGEMYSAEEMTAPIKTEFGYTTRQNEINKLINSAQDNFTSAFEQTEPKTHEVEGGLH